MKHISHETYVAKNTTRTGLKGEYAVRKHLQRKGYLHLESNFRSKVGEIDIVMEKDSVVHFIEVKTVTHETDAGKQATVSHGTVAEMQVPNELVPRRLANYKSNTVPHGTYRPEENVHAQKLRKLHKTIEIWLSVNRYEGEWQLDVAAVRINTKEGSGVVKLIENIIVE